MAGIIAAGGITADHIKGGTISYDRLKIAKASATDISERDFAMWPGGSIDVELLDPSYVPGIPGTYWDQIKCTFVNAQHAQFTVDHNSLTTLAGLPQVKIKLGTQYVDLGTQFERVHGAYLDGVRVSCVGTYQNGYRLHVALMGGETSPGITKTVYLRARRHAIA